MTNIITSPSYSFKITYKTEKGENRAILIDSKDTIFCERSSIEMAFFTATKRIVNVQSIEMRDRQTKQLIYKIFPSALGMPNAYDKLIFRTIEKLIKNNKHDITVNPCFAFSFKDVLKELSPEHAERNQIGGTQRNKIKNAVRRIAGQVIEINGKYRSLELEGVSGRYIQDYGFINEINKQTKEKYNHNYIIFGSFYIHSLKNHNPRLINYGYLKALESPIATALYELLSGSFWYGTEYKIKYSQLCFILGIKEQANNSRAENRRRSRYYLKDAHNELIQKKFVSQIEYENINNDPENPSDFWIIYYPGVAGQKKYLLNKEINKFLLQAPSEIEELIKKFHVKRNKINPENFVSAPGEKEYVRSLLDKWKQPDKISIFIDFGVKELNQAFPDKPTLHIKAIANLLPQFEQKYEQLLKEQQKQKQAEEVFNRAKDKSKIIFPDKRELQIMDINKNIITIGKDYKDTACYYLNDLVNCRFE